MCDTWVSFGLMIVRSSRDALKMSDDLFELCFTYVNKMCIIHRAQLRKRDNKLCVRISDSSRRFSNRVEDTTR